MGCGDSSKVVNSTVYGNENGGVRLGTSADNPLTGSGAINNIVVGEFNSVGGFRERHWPSIARGSA